MSYLYLSVDFGDSYVGLSVSNGIIPRTLPVFKYPKGDYEKLRLHLVEIINLNKVSYVVIGVPFDVKSSSKIKEIFLSVVFRERFLREKII